MNNVNEVIGLLRGLSNDDIADDVKYKLSRSFHLLESSLGRRANITRNADEIKVMRLDVCSKAEA